MIDEEDGSALPQAHREALLYDYFKHLTSLALITLGGILTLSQMDTARTIKPLSLWITIVLVAAGGVAAFTGSSDIARSRYTGTPLSKRFDLYRKAAPALYALGTGGALAMFADVLS